MNRLLIAGVVVLVLLVVVTAVASMGGSTKPPANPPATNPPVYPSTGEHNSSHPSRVPAGTSMVYTGCGYAYANEATAMRSCGGGQPWAFVGDRPTVKETVVYGGIPGDSTDFTSDCAKIFASGTEQQRVCPVTDGAMNQYRYIGD